MQIYRTVVGNTKPDIQFKVQRNGTVIDLTSAQTVKLAIQKEWNAVTTNGAHKTCSIVTANEGVVRYTPLTNDFPQEGRYIGDVEVTYLDGTERIFDQILIVARAAIS